jgi:hypothetical protein
MKWFKHFSDAYSNLKMQQVVAECGMRGYGFFWVCCELVAQQGQNFRLKGEKSWKKVLSHITTETEGERDKFLQLFAEINLIDKKALEMGDLYLPKMREYSDEYTDKLRRISRQNRDNVVLEEEGEEEQKKKEKKINSTKILAHWNVKGIITHRKMSRDAENELSRIERNNDYSEQEIITAIDVYAAVFEPGVKPEEKKYWWSHKWNLYEFLRRGMKQFNGKKPDDYLKGRSGQVRHNQTDQL